MSKPLKVIIGIISCKVKIKYRSSLAVNVQICSTCGEHFSSMMNPRTHKNGFREDKDGSLTLVLLKSLRDQLTHLYGRKQSCPQPTAQRDFIQLFLPTPADSKGCAPNPQLCADKRHSTKKKTYPERVKKKGCCQDQREVGSHGGERARGPRAESGAGAGAGQARDSSPVIPVFGSGCWVRPSSLSVSALQLCSDFARLSQLQVSAALGIKAQSPTPPPGRAHAHTHLKQYSSLIHQRTSGVRQRFAV